MFSGLGTNYTYLESRVNRFVALAPCIYGDPSSALFATPEKLLSIDINIFGGEDWKSNGLNKLCREFG